MNPDQLCSMKGYYKGDIDTWKKLVYQLVSEVCGGLVTSKEFSELEQLIIDKKFIPAGRYLYYAGRDAKFYNNCFLLRAEEDTREEWGSLANRVLSCLMVGGGVGVNYDVIRKKGSILKRTGGTASGVIALMELIDYVGFKVQQGGSRRSALFGSLKWSHPEITDFLNAKNWSKEILDQKLADYNFKAPLDCTNISPSYDSNWLWESEDKDSQAWKVFRENVRLALLNGEPGFSFNLVNPFENLRNACCEVCSSDDLDVCNLGSINLAKVESLYDFQNSIRLATLFLLCGSIRAELPNAKVEAVREKNNRIGIGLMGVHEFQIQRGRKYAETEELEEFLYYYKKESDKFKVIHANRLKCTAPVACRAVAPTGTISMLAETTSGIEPIFAKAYKRRYLKEDKWHYSYVIDSTAYRMQQKYDAEIESAHEISIENRIKVISLLESYVDQGVSSTINLSAPITDAQEIDKIAEMIRYEVKLNADIRGLTFYPNGARGNVLEEVDIVQALVNRDVEFREHDICDIAKKSTCG